MLQFGREQYVWVFERETISFFHVEPDKSGWTLLSESELHDPDSRVRVGTELSDRLRSLL